MNNFKGLFMQLVLALPALWLTTAATAQTDLYKLTHGDSLTATVSGAPSALSATIDLDGYLRFPGLVAHPIVGLSIVDAEQTLAQAIIDNGIFVEPQVTLSIESYAEIIVSGDVRSPGRYDYFPNITVEIAASLASVNRSVDDGQLGASLQLASAEGQVRRLGTQILQQAVQIAQYHAQLVGAGEISMSDLPNLAGVSQEQLEAEVGVSNRIIAAQIERDNQLERLWQSRIDTVSGQVSLLEQRLELQADVVTTRAARVEDVRTLVDQGLRTVNVLVDEERILSDAMSLQLSLRSSLAEAKAELTDIEQAQADYLSAQRVRLSTELASGVRALDQLHDEIETQILRIRTIEELGVMGALSDLVEIQYTIIRSGSGEAIQLIAEASTRILPGDAIVVDVISE